MSINQASYGYGAAKSAIREIAAHAAARKAQIGDEKVFDFSLGNPSIPTPPEVAASIQRSLALPSMQLHGYTPASGLPEAREAVAASLSRRFGEGVAHAEDLYLTCGAAASITISLHALVNAGDEVLAIVPYFPEYRVWIEAAGAVCVEVMVDTESFEVDAQAVAAAITPRTKAIIVNSPNNPVGSIYGRDKLEALARVLEAADHPIYLIADEPYREIAYGVEVPWIPDLYARTLVCYSYSKCLSLPGERIGWVLVPPTNPEHDELIPAIAGAGRKLGFVCAPALFQRMLIDCADVVGDIEAYARNRAALTEGFSRMGYEYIEPEGAFYLWVRSLEPDAWAFYERASAHEIFPVPSDSFGCPGWVRVCYCVSYETIVNSMPAWQALIDEYR